MLLAKRPISVNSITLYPWEYSFYYKTCKLDKVKKKESPSASQYVNIHSACGGVKLQKHRINVE